MVITRDPVQRAAEGDSVSVTYDKEGVYDVTVMAKNSSGEDTKTVEGLVFVTSELEKVANCCCCLRIK